MSIDINDVRRFLEEHYAKVRTIEEVAGEFGISGETLRKEFVRRYREPISLFLLGLRITAMKDKLITTELRCFEICYQVGYEREDTGAKVFKRVTGSSMQSFRRNHRVMTESIGTENESI